MSLFEYRSGHTIAHSLDPRAKLFMVCLVSLSLTASGWAGSFLFWGIMVPWLYQIRLGFFTLILRLKGFLFFLGLIILTRGLVAPGDVLVTGFGITLSTQGLVQGGLVALRFFNIMLLGLLFCATTRPSDLNSALQWFAAPLPFIPEKQLGMIFSLALRFFPLIFRQYHETRDALRARCGHLRKNPIQRVNVLCLALVTKILKTAEGTAMAMEARGYTEDRMVKIPVPDGREPLFLIAGTGICLLMFWL